MAKDLRKVRAKRASQFVNKIEKKLREAGHEGVALSGEFTGLFRPRVGDYRIIDACTEDACLVLRIGHRNEVYRKRA